MTGKFATLIKKKKKKNQKASPESMCEKGVRVSKRNKYDHTTEPSKERESFPTQNNNANCCSHTIPSAIHPPFPFPRIDSLVFHSRTESLRSGGKEVFAETSRGRPTGAKAAMVGGPGCLSAAGPPRSSPLATTPGCPPISVTSLGRQAEPQQRRS